MENAIHNLINEHRLPASFYETVQRWYVPIADELAKLAKQKASNEKTLILGVQGCQGSGKSTLSDFLKLLVNTRHSLNAAVLSIDDFYLTKNERIALASRVHPLLSTRGVPGTHDTQLAIDTIRALQNLKSSQQHLIPRFNKAIDDRAPESDWDEVSGPVDIIILEGWCVGLDAQSATELSSHTNELEELEDATRIWRTYVNDCLAKEYQELFSLIEYLVMLAPPSFKCVFDWRLLQEEKLKEKLKMQISDCSNNSPNNSANKGIMNPEQIKRFISHYQRLTEHALLTLPAKSDWLLRLGDDHCITSLEKKSAHDNTLDTTA